MITTLAIALSQAAVAHAQPRPNGVVGAVEVDASGALRSARSAGGATWRAERLTGHPAPEIEPPTAALEAVREAWESAQFQRCLALVQGPELRLERLLGNGWRELAARAQVYAAGCARPVDPDGARQRLVRAASARLPIGDAAAATEHPPIIALADEASAAAAARGSVSVRLVSQPEGARVMVDGGAQRCARAPCELAMPPGEHVFTFASLGHSSRTVLRPIETDGLEVAVALDPASSDALRQQLAHAIARRQDPQSLLELASDALGATVVVLAWEHDRGASAALLDRREEGVEPSRMDETEIGEAVRSAVSEWRARVEPFDPIPWIVGTSVGLVVVGAVVTVLSVLATSGELTERSFVFE